MLSSPHCKQLILESANAFETFIVDQNGYLLIVAVAAVFLTLQRMHKLGAILRFVSTLLAGMFAIWLALVCVVAARESQDSLGRAASHIYQCVQRGSAVGAHASGNSIMLALIKIDLRDRPVRIRRGKAITI